MAVRQYIGARYVPKIYEGSNGSQWEQGVAYEGLTIVTYNGNSFTSKKPVPATIGSPNLNPEYWVSTGIYNAQIEEYRQEVEDVADRVEEVNTNLSADIATIEARQAFGNRKLVLIGDSYNATDHYSWGQKIINALGLTVGVNAWNIAMPGAGFGTASDNNFYVGLSTARNAMTAEQAQEITDVVIAGGANDWSSDSAVIGSRVNLCENFVIGNFPNAKLHIVCCGWAYALEGEREGILTAYNIYGSYLRYASLYTKAYTQFLIPNRLADDMTHPTETSNTRLAREIMNYINGGTPWFWEYTELATTFSGNDGGTVTIKGEVSPYGYHIYKNDSEGFNYPNNPISITNNLATKLGTHSGTAGNQFFMRKAEFSAQAMARQVSGGVTRFIPISAIIVVEKQTNALSWDIKIMNRTIVDGSYTINDINGVYFNFDATLGLVKS